MYPIVVTDPDCNQQYQQTGEDSFLFSEDRREPFGDVYVFEFEVNLSEYPDAAIVDACSTFGYTEDEVLAWLWLGSNKALMAECIFELS